MKNIGILLVLLSIMACGNTEENPKTEEISETIESAKRSTTIYC